MTAKSSFTCIQNFLLFLTFFLVSCTNAVSSSEDFSKSTSPPIELETAVTVDTAHLGVFLYVIEANGKVKAKSDQQFDAVIGGSIAYAPIRNGDRVRKGQVLLKFSTNEIDHKIEKLRLDEFNGLKEYESQLLGYDNLSKGLTQEQLEAIKKKLQISTGLSGARHGIKVAEFEKGQAIIKSPFDGKLYNVLVKPSDRVKPGDKLFGLFDPSKLLLRVHLLEADIFLIKPGQLARLQPFFNQDRFWEAEVYEINPLVDEKGMVSVDLLIRNPVDGGQDNSIDALFPGMNCNARIEVPFHQRIAVPKEAVVMRDGKAVIFTVEKGRAKWNYITLGRSNDRQVEVLDGIKDGSIFVTTNNLQLAHGSPVTIQPVKGSDTMEISQQSKQPNATGHD